MDDDRDLVRSRVDIVGLIGETVPLKRSGRRFLGLCPFHDDQRPSFSVAPDLGVYRCWACGEKGDVFTWVMKTQRVEFPEALRLLAERAGVTLTRKTSAEQTGRREKALALNLAALAFFREQLGGAPGALAYCERRGLVPETLERWEVGYAPADDTALAAYLKRTGQTLADAKEFGLLDGDPSGGYAAKLRDRIIFPIRDLRGQVVGFGGRALGDTNVKYMNTPETMLFSKRHVLYGMHRAKDAIAREGAAVLVEGYLDVIACHEAGLDTAVATLGTSLSEDHAALLGRWAQKATVLYDCDEAGRRAAERAADALRGAGLEVSVALLPAGEDPDSLLRSGGVEALRKAASEGLTPLAFRLSLLETTHPPRSEEFWREAVAALAGEPNAMEIERHLFGLATRYPGIRDPEAATRALRRRIAEARRGSRRAPARAAAPASKRALPIGSERAVVLGALSESTRPLSWPLLARAELFLTDAAALVAEAFVGTFGEEPPSGPASAWLHRMPEDARDVLVDLALEPDEPVTEAVLADAVAWLESRRHRRAVVEIRHSEAPDDDRLAEAQERLRRVHGGAEEP